MKKVPITEHVLQNTQYIAIQMMLRNSFIDQFKVYITFIKNENPDPGLALNTSPQLVVTFYCPAYLVAVNRCGTQSLFIRGICYTD